MGEQEIRSAIAQAVKAARHNKELSQRDAAERAKVSYSYLQLIEVGKTNATVPKLHRLARAFNCELHDLIPNPPED